MRTIDLHTADGVMVRAPGHGILLSYGVTVPTNGTAGYATGCNFIHTDGGAGTAFYLNEGSVTSCAFVAVAAMTAAQEALIGATAGTATASVAAILDANKALDVVRTASLMVGASGSEVAVVLGGGMAAGAGITAGTDTVCAHSVVKAGAIFKTEILLDMDGLHGGGTNGDIIGVDAGAVNCHLGQITAAVNGTIVYGQITCLETPAGGSDDIDFYGSVDEDTGAQDAALSTITGEEQLLDNGAWAAAVATPIALTALPDADGYLYMANPTASDAEYSAGIFLIELWGV